LHLGEAFHTGQAGVGGDLAEPAGHLLGPVAGIAKGEGGIGLQVRAA
jgi:hypothetical protein